MPPAIGLSGVRVPRLNLTSRFLIPVGVVLALAMAPLVWVLGTVQARRMERVLRDQLIALAVSARYMVHSAAAGYCRARNLQFHRVQPGRAGAGPAAALEGEAMAAFAGDPGLPWLARRYPGADGAPRLVVLAPARLQQECVGCHAAGGVSAFRDRRMGDLVGAFGVSASLSPLDRDVARTRLLAALAGLGALATTGLLAAYFVRRSILRPLGDLAAAIASMGQGDLDVRAHVQRADEIGRLAESFNAMVARLRRANEDYMEVLAFVSHELKHPVAAMITDARVLADGYLGPVTSEQARKLERLAVSGYQLLELVAEYLDLAKIEAGTLELQARRVPFRAEVAEPAAAMVQAQAQARGMSLDLCLPADLDLVECDPHLLKIVLVNLLGNGVKYGREGGAVRLTVEAAPGRLKVAVWNEGPGFPSWERNRLFRKFSRLQDPVLRERRGTGIGLYTAWHIVRLHGGSMDACSEQGQWAEFSFQMHQPLRWDGIAGSAAADAGLLEDLPAVDG